MAEVTLVKLPSDECCWTLLMISQYCSGAVRQQVITWANVGPHLWHHMALLGYNELNGQVFSLNFTINFKSSVFPLNVTDFCDIGWVKWVSSQYHWCWWPGALAPGHEQPQCWPIIKCPLWEFPNELHLHVFCIKVKLLRSSDDFLHCYT